MKNLQHLFFMLIVMMAFVACDTNHPHNAYEGVWTVLEGYSFPMIVPGGDTAGYKSYSEYYDQITITHDSIIAVNKTERHSHYYKLKENNVIFLERTWLRDAIRPDYQLETRIYFDEDKHLIIEKFAQYGYGQIYPPDYTSVIMEKK